MHPDGQRPLDIRGAAGAGHEREVGRGRLHRSDGSVAGAPTDSSFGWIKLLNKQQQADYTIRAFLLASRPPYASFVVPLMLWNLNFGTIPQMIDSGRQEAGFSLLDFDGSPRPVFAALAAAPKQ